jgi:hypothetical protein
MNIRGILTILVLFGVFGLGFITWGWSDYEESKTATETPVAVELADLEEGVRSENNHVKIGPHVACYYAAVIVYHKSKGLAQARPDPNTNLSECFYPILSADDPTILEIQKLEKTYGSIEKIPENVPIDKPTRFSVVVKTNRFHQVKDVPKAAIRTEASVQGLILNRSRPIGADEKKLLIEEFPAVDFDRVMVLEDGRVPSSTAWCFGRIAIGAVALLLGIVLVLGAIARRGT